MVPFVDLKKQYQNIQNEVNDAIAGVLASGQFVLGPEVSSFEDEFAGYSGAKFGVGVNTGTSALHLALLAAGVGPGDEVVTTPHTFVATVAAIRYTGARPVFVDIDRDSFNLDPSLLDSVMTTRTKAIIPVHLYGQCAAMDPILEIARSNGLVVIEDACQAHGAEYLGHRAGSLGDMACFSFYPGKNLGAFGEGGMVTTSRPEYAEKIRAMRDWGQSKKYHHDIIGFNYRMEALQGAILRVKLRYLERWTQVRRECAALYDALLRNAEVLTPKEMPHSRHVYHLYVIRSAHRAGLIAQLNSAGVQTGIHYPIPVHLQGAHADLGYKVGDFPNSEAAAREVLSLPMHGNLTAQEVETVCSAIASASLSRA
jgi:dTDP-4-amino-4,6-dideoxygalactose transaminase